MPDALQSILIQAGVALAPLRAIDTPDKAVVFFRQLGYEMPPGSFGSSLSGLANHGTELVNAVKELATANGDSAVIAALAKITLRLGATIASIKDLHTQVEGGGAAGLPNIYKQATGIT